MPCPPETNVLVSSTLKGNAKSVKPFHPFSYCASSFILIPAYGNVKLLIWFHSFVLLFITLFVRLAPFAYHLTLCMMVSHTVELLILPLPQLLNEPLSVICGASFPITQNASFPLLYSIFVSSVFPLDIPVPRFSIRSKQTGQQCVI